MTAHTALFPVGSRVAFDNSLASFAHDWEYGTVVEVKNEGLGFMYRVTWDDGFVDRPGAAWYGEDEFTPERLAVSLPL